MTASTVRDANRDEESVDNTTPLLPSTEQPSSDGRWDARLWLCGVLWLIAGQLVLVVVGYVLKILERTVPVFQIIAMRSCICLPLALTCIKIMKVKTVWGAREIRYLCLTKALMGAFSVAFMFSSLYFLPLGDVTALFKLNMVFTAMFGWLLKWEVVNMSMLFGAFGCVIGGVFIIHPPFLFGGHDEWGIGRMAGIGMAGTAAITSSIGFLSVGRISQRASPFNIMMWFHSVGVVTAIPFLIAGIPHHVVWNLTLKEGGLIGLVGVLTFLVHAMMTHGVQLTNATLGSAMGSFELVLSYVVGYFLLNEPLYVSTGVGIVCIGIGIALVALGKHKSKKATGS